MDRVKLRPFERAELNDTLALQDLVYEYSERLIGALLGCGDVVTKPRGGVVSLPNIVYSQSGASLTIDSFQFLEVRRGSAALSQAHEATPEAKIITFNSAESDHVNHAIDVSSYRQNGTNYDIYARFITVETDTEARRSWDLAAQQEVSQTMTTRKRERVEFTVRNSGNTPTQSSASDIGKYVKIAEYQIINNILSYESNWAWDESNDRVKALFVQSAQPTNDQISSKWLADINTTNSASTGILSHISAFKLLNWLIFYSGSQDANHAPPAAANWFSQPRYSLAEIATRIDSLRTDTDANTSFIAEHNLIPFSAYIFAEFNTSTNTMSTPIITYRRPSNYNDADDFQVIFSAHRLTTAGTPTTINSINDFKTYVGSPCLVFNNAFVRQVISLSIAPVVGQDTSGQSNSMIDYAGTIVDEPISMPWGYEQDGLPISTDIPNFPFLANVIDLNGVQTTLGGLRLSVGLTQMGRMQGINNTYQAAYFISFLGKIAP